MQRRSDRRTFMLSGLLHCALCGGRMQHNGGSTLRYFACSHALKRGTCSNRRNVPIVRAQCEVVAMIRRELTECIAEVGEIVADELRRWAASKPNRRIDLTARRPS